MFAMRDDENSAEMICSKCPRFSYVENHLTSADGATGATLSRSAGSSQRSCQSAEGKGSEIEIKNKPAIINRFLGVS